MQVKLLVPKCTNCGSANVDLDELQEPIVGAANLIVIPFYCSACELCFSVFVLFEPEAA